MIIVVVGPAGSRLTAQLDRLPDRASGRVHPLAPASLDGFAALAERAAEDGEGLALVPGDLIISDTPLLAVLDDPRPTARVLTGAGHQPVRVAAGRVTAAGSTHHRLEGTDTAAGLLHLPADAVAGVATAWAEAARVGRARGWDDLDPLAAALVAVVRAGVPVSAVPAGPYVASRSPDSMRDAEALDEEDLSWRRASRGGDGVWSTFVLRPISRRISRRAVRVGLTPNQVTAFSFAAGLLAAALIATGRPVAMVVGALLLQVSIVVDCVDGEVARSTRTYSALGAWADVASDRVKEYAVLAAIAAATGAWWLALLGLAVQLIRHMCDYAFADTLLAWWREPVVDQRPYAATEAPVATGSGGDVVDRAGTGPRGRGPVHWVRQALHVQIGERWLLISAGLIVGVAIGRPVLALLLYLAGVAVGLGWVLAGWTLRTLSHARRGESMPVPTATRIARLRDDGLLSPRPRGPRSPRSWLLPALATTVEAGTLLICTVNSPDGVQASAYLGLFLVAWHRYDLHYRDRAGRTPVPALVSRLGGGWAVRSLVVVIAAQLHVLGPVLVVGAAWLFLVYVPESLYRALATPPTRSYDAASLSPGRRLGLLRKHARRAVAVPVTRLLMRLLPPRRIALVAGLPDSEENALATAVGLADRYPGEVVLVAGDPAAARRHLDHTAALLGGDAGRVRIVAKSASYLTFVRAELVAYTHGLYDSPRPVGRRLHVNLWHGTGPKWNANANFSQRIGAQAHSASSPLWGREAIRALAVDPRTRLVAGNPRCDVAARPGSREVLIDLHLHPDRPLVVWLPTFRRSERAGLVGLAEGDQLTADHQAEIAAIYRAAKAARVQLVAKPHRLDADSYADLGIPTISTEDLTAVGVSVYQLLGLADGLISDYSSVWVDLLGTSTSIALWVPDLARYQQARGLNRPSLELVAADLFLTAANAPDFFAAVAAGRTWRPDARERLAARIEFIDVPPGTVTATMLTQLGALAADLFGDDLGLR